MTQLWVWIICCFLAALVLRRRIRVAIGAVLALWVLVPAVGNPLITGVANGPLSVHAATWFILAILAVRLLHDPGSVTAVLGRHFALFLIMAMVILAAALSSLTSLAGGGMVLLVDQIAAPVAFFLIMLSAAAGDEGLVSMVRAVLIGLAAVAGLVALAQWLTHSVLFYEAGFRTQYWFNPGTDRWMGTLDQPLALSLLISVTAPLVAGLSRNALQSVLLVLMVVGVLITQSRVGILVVALSVAAVVVFAKRRIWVRVVLLAVLSVATWLIMTSPLIEGVVARFEDDTGSAEARARALEYFLARWTDYLIAGQGVGSSYRVAVQGGLQTSFENPLVMYSVDFGIVFAVLYFGAMAILVLRNAGRHHYRGLTLAGILAVAVCQTYSSLATRSAAGIIVWTVLAMVVIAGESVAGQEQELAVASVHRPAHVAGGPADRPSLLPAPRAARAAAHSGAHAAAPAAAAGPGP